MEVTVGVVDKFKIASLKVSPSTGPLDKFDLEFVLTHDSISGRIIGISVVTNSNVILSACISEGLSLSNEAEKRATVLVKEVCRLILKELM